MEENRDPKQPQGKKKWVLSAAMVGAALLLVFRGKLTLLLYMFWMFVTHRSTAASIGIIGGADGPTAVFVTGPKVNFWLPAGIALVLGIGVFLWLRSRNKSK